jgi:DNA-binding LacI/PurR family transcriptional regulator
MTLQNPHLSKSAPDLTMSDIAKLARVSESTVSRALADNPLIAPKTRARIQDIARLAGYSVNPAASSLRTKQSNQIAVIIPMVHENEQHLSDPFMMSMLAHLGDELSNRGYDLLLSKIVSHKDGWIEQFIRSRRSAGAILIGQSLEHHTIESAARSGLPIAVWGAKMDGQTYSTVGTDNFQGGYLATSHLIKTGRRQIAFFGNLRVPEISQRYQGYLRAHAEAVVRPLDELKINCGFTASDALRATQEVLAANLQFDGIVAGSDVIAMSAMRALNEAGRRVPDQVGIVGFDDIEMAAYTAPTLTTIRQNLQRGAKLLVEMVLASAAGTPVESIEMPAELIIRNSTNIPR